MLLVSAVCANAQLKSLMESNSIVTRPTNFWAVAASSDTAFSNAVQAVQLRDLNSDALTNRDTRGWTNSGGWVEITNTAIPSSGGTIRATSEDGGTALQVYSGQIYLPAVTCDGDFNTTSNTLACQFIMRAEGTGFFGNGGGLTNLNGTNIQAGTVLSSAIESNAWYLATNQVASDGLWTVDGNSITNGQVAALSGPNHDPSVRVFRDGGFQSWLGGMDTPALEVKAGEIVLTNDVVHVKTGAMFTEFNATGIVFNGVVVWPDSIVETTNRFAVSGEEGKTTNLTVSIPGGSLVIQIRGGVVTGIVSTPP